MVKRCKKTGKWVIWNSKQTKILASFDSKKMAMKHNDLMCHPEKWVEKVPTFKGFLAKLKAEDINITAPIPRRIEEKERPKNDSE